MSMAEPTVTSTLAGTDQRQPEYLGGLGDEGVPIGTTKSRIEQLHGIAHLHHRTSDAALRERDRENVSIG